MGSEMCIRDRVIEHGYYYLKMEDLDALAEYLISLVPIENDINWD